MPVPVHAFVDESARNGRYLIAVAVVQPFDVRQRQAMCRLLLPGQRELHFYREKPSRRRALADVIARLPVEVHIYARSWDRHPEPARQDCIERMAHDLLARQAQRLMIDTRKERDVHDDRTLRRVLGPHPRESRLTYSHVDSTVEPLLWIADGAAWCQGASSDWQARIRPIVAAVTDLGGP
jgi:hypothetical protein